ncbi:MAG: HupE/UreJ family protein [Bacteroidota bacterium]|nr:HupE/UreJ family protein [Bacteroidota bacterium]
MKRLLLKANYKHSNRFTNKSIFHQKQTWLASCAGLFLLLFSATSLYAHTINYALEKAPVNDVIWFYLKLGFTHILPQGFDHILFVCGLCLLSTKVSVILWQATAFTVAHSITLALSMQNIIVAPSAVVEPIIALSILFIAIENLLLTKLKPWRVLIVFMFGLIHGMGFASSLNEIGLPPNKFATSILSFNAGVELGQITVILTMFALIIIPLKNIHNYRKRVVYPLSILIGLIALYWTIQRVFFV